jgi:hypothetical protein
VRALEKNIKKWVGQFKREVMKEKEIKKPEPQLEEKPVARIKEMENSKDVVEKMSPVEQERREMKTGEPGAAMEPLRNYP